MMCRIKVLQVITGLIPGGAERLVLDLMKFLDHSVFDVRLVSIIDDLGALEVYDCRNVPVEVFDLRRGARLSALRGMRAFVKDFAPDVIHAHMFHGLLSALAVSRCLLPSPAICFTSHLGSYPRIRAVPVRMLKGWRDADVIFTAHQHPDLNARRTEVIPNGVPVPVSPPERIPWRLTDQVRLLALGRLAEQKDPLGLLWSVARLNLPTLHLDFVGSGPLEGSVRSLAAELGLADRVRLLGTRSDVRELLRGADIFAMHSKYEGMPLALLEAGAEAMPVVSTPVGAIPEVIGADRGWLALPDQFSEALRDAVSNPQIAISAGKRLHMHVLNTHSIHAVVRDHERLYLSLSEARNK